jgi:hypothetical protein
LKPVAYFLKKLSSAESNYEIHDKKLLAIVRAMEKWKEKLIEVKNPFVVLFDHKNLQYFMTTLKLSEKQIRWFLTFSQFRIQLKFRAEKKAQRSNALLKREQDMPGGKKNERFKNRINQLLKNEWLPSKYRLKRNPNSFKFKLPEPNRKNQKIQQKFLLIKKEFLKVVIFSKIKKRS